MLVLNLVAMAWAGIPTEYYDLGFVLRGEGAFSGGVGAPSVEFDGGVDRLVMYFESPAPAADVPDGCANSYRIGRATSEDGVEWTVDANPVFEANPAPGSPRYCSVAQPAILYDGSQWNLFYSASKEPAEGSPTNTPSGIGWATSADGITWTPQTEQLVAFNTASIGLASATALNGTMYMAYAEYPDIFLISRPISGGGGWTASEKVIDHAAMGEWASNWVLGPSLLCNETSDTPLGMLFAGDTTGTAIRSLAFAVSGNAHSWTLDDGSPLVGGSLDYGAVNHWETLRAGSGHAMWYSKTDETSGNKAIGAAVTDTHLGQRFPRVCPDPWFTVPDDTGDTGGDTAIEDTADTANADTADTADTAGGDVKCDCPDAAGGCGCSTGGTGRGFGGMFSLVGLSLALRRRGRDKA